MPAMAMLDEIAQHPNSNQLRFWVVGHTDDTGSEEFNHQLSKNRTQMVVYHLLMSGIKPYNILFEYYGENCPINQNEDDGSRAENRRVEVHISNIGLLEEPGLAGLYSEEMFRRPMPDVIPDQEVFAIENGESHCIETASGSMIDIPPMAFMDAYGRPISGEVEVSYLELNDPFSIFLSGIGMKAEECNAGSHLETAAMFSISATHRGKPVEIRQDKPLYVDLVSSSMDQNYDFLFMDPASESWNNIGIAAINEEDAALIAVAENLSPGVASYLKETDYLSVAQASRITLEERFLNTEYLDRQPIASYYRFLRGGDENERKQFETEWKKAASFKAKVLPPNPNNSKETIHFTVQKQSKFNQHQEYLLFNWHVWEYAGELSRKELLAQLHEKRFHDLRVRFDEECDSVSIELKDLDGIMKLAVKKITIENMSAELQKRMLDEFAPVFREWRNKKNRTRFESKYNFYKDVLAGREKRIQKRADAFDAKADRLYQNELHVAWKRSQKLMNEAERMMSSDNWASYCNSISNTLEAYYARQQGGTSVVRTLAMDRMGIYNCARTLDSRHFQNVKPRFVLSGGKALKWNTTYLFDDSVNSVIAYDAGQILEVGLAPGTLRMMILSDEEGNLYRLNESEVIAMNRGKVAHRIMHVTQVDQTARSLDEMREMLGLVLK